MIGSSAAATMDDASDGELERAPRVGTIVSGKYRIERQLAIGGLGIVVVASHVELHHTVAIKYLQADVRRRDVLVERFKQEAQLAASLRSDHVVRVHDVGFDERCGPYLVMEYLEGEDLGAVVERGPVGVRTAVGWMLQACDALSEAHDLGIVHRDIKPENLFLARRSGGGAVLKLLDFGISRSSDSAAPPLSGARRIRRITDSGESFGTPTYMSPEQLRSAAAVDARSDIWSVGVVLFELVAGELPFVGATLFELYSSIASGAPRRLVARGKEAAAAAGAIERIVLRCLEKEPSARYATVRDLARDLEAVAHDLDRARPVEPARTTVPPRPARARRAPAAMLIAAVMAGAAVGAVHLASSGTRSTTSASPRVLPIAPSAPVGSAAPSVSSAPPPVVTSAAAAAKPIASTAVGASALSSSIERAAAPSEPAAPTRTHADYSEFGDRR